MAASIGRVGVFRCAKNCLNTVKCWTVYSNEALLPMNSYAIGRRYLFSAEILGLENYKRQKMGISERMGNMKEKFCTRMADYLKTSESNTIFTEDLKSMVYLADTEAELEITEQMIRRFHTQNSDLRFSNFVFGPLVMRLLYLLGKPDVAYRLFTDKTMSGFFDQMSSCVVLMDLLYENKCYDQVLHVMDTVKEKQLGGYKYPMDCVTLALASCYQMNTQKSFKKLISLVKEARGASSTISLRGSIYSAMLALTQKKPDVALEMMSLVSLQRAVPTPVAYVNVMTLTYAAMGRVEDAILTMRTIIEQDLPDHIKYRGEIFEEVLVAVHDVANKNSSKEVQHQLSTTEKALRDGGLISAQSLAEYLCRPIIRQRRLQEGYKQRERPPVGGVKQWPGGRRLSNRPGLLD